MSLPSFVETGLLLPPGPLIPRLTDASIDTYPQVNFLVIINPDSGPGSTASPDENYSREISQLNNRTNVQTIGYIPTGYGSRDISSVLQDISTYNGWPSNGDEGVYVEGVFFDETPNVYTDAIGAFYEQIDGEVKGSSGFQGDKLVSPRGSRVVACNNMELPR